MMASSRARSVDGASDAIQATTAPPVLVVDDLHTRLRTPRGVMPVVGGVSFSIAEGRTLAIVGESGSGKTMLARSIMRLLPEALTLPSAGSLRFAGQDLCALDARGMGRIRGRQIAMVFQDPMTSLNPVLKVGTQIVEVLRHHLGMGRGQARQRAQQLLDDVGVPMAAQRLDEYPHQLSGGLRQRVVIAMALACGPRLLIADEPTTALDVTIQAQILRLLKRQQRQSRMAMIFVSHDLATVAGMADDIAVMYAGRIVEYGPARAVLNDPRMPYTQALLRSIPRAGSAARGRLHAIAGRPPNLADLPIGCAFAARCSQARPDCLTRQPELSAGRHRYACFHPSPVAVKEQHS